MDSVWTLTPVLCIVRTEARLLYRDVFSDKNSSMMFISLVATAVVYLRLAIFKLVISNLEGPSILSSIF